MNVNNIKNNINTTFLNGGGGGGGGRVITAHAGGVKSESTPE